MAKKPTAILAVLLLLCFTAGPALGSGSLMKKHVRMTGKEIPTVVSNQKTFDARVHLMQSPGTVIDSTEYDWQENGSMEDHIAMFDDGGTVKINATMMWGLTGETPNRAMNYYTFDGTGWNTGITDLKAFGTLRNGFGAMTQLDDGSAIIVTHGPLDGGTTRAISAVDAFPQIRAFSYYDGNDDIDFIWPIATVNSDGSILMVGSYNGSYPPGTGLTNQVAWTTAPDRNSPFSDTWNLIEDVSPDWIANDVEWPAVASGTTLCGMAIGDVCGTMRYYESDDFGATFTEQIVATADTAGLGNVLDSTAAQLPWITCDMMYVGDEPHIVWTTGQGLNDGGTYGVTDFKATIMHWSPSTGVDVAVEAWNQSADSTRADFVLVPWNTLSVDWPSIGMAADGNTLVMVFTGTTLGDIDPISQDPDGNDGVAFLDIYAVASGDGGNTWTDPVNITNPDGSITEWDDRYPSIAKTNWECAADPGKDVYMIYSSDDRGGTWQQGTEGSYNMDYIKVTGIALEDLGIGDQIKGGPSLPRAASLMQNYPNPFNPSTSISFQLADRSDVTVKIFDVRGRLVRTLVDGVKEAGEYTVQWNGKESTGQQVSSGIYFYTMETNDGFSSTRKMVVLK